MYRSEWVLSIDFVLLKNIIVAYF